VVVLKKLAWGPIVSGLNAREERIAASLEKAAEIEKATRALAESNRLELETSQKIAQSIMGDAREAGKAAAAEIVAKAQEEIDGQRERAKRELQLEIQKAKAELRENTAELTLMATSSLLGRALSSDPGEQRRLVEEALRDAESVAKD
jgi:F-type H+-transporting ATPase subunit b